MASKLVFTALLAIASAADYCTNDEIKGIAQCYTPFMNFYGLQVSGTILPPYKTYITARQAYLQSADKSALGPMCNAQNTLRKCVEKYPCFTKDTFLAMGQAEEQIYQYWEDLAEENYICGDGYTVLQQEFYCLRAVNQHSASAIELCDDNLNSQLQNGIDYCTAFNTFMKCMYNVYSSGCDNNAGSLICQEIRAGLYSIGLPCELNGKLNTCPPFVKGNPKLAAVEAIMSKNRLF